MPKAVRSAQIDALCQSNLISLPVRHRARPESDLTVPTGLRTFDYTHIMLRLTLLSPAFRCRPKTVPAGMLQCRAISSQVKPVELHFDKVVPPDGNETRNPLVILHGLL